MSTVTIPKDNVVSLRKAQAHLDLLESLGVDNWEHYKHLPADDAVKIHQQVAAMPSAADPEIVPASIRICVDTIGPRRHKRDLMIAFGLDGYNFLDAHLTWEQAEELRAELDKAIARKPAL